MRRMAAGLVGIGLALATVPLLIGTAQASCAGPEIDVSPKTALASGQLTMTGRGFAAGCNDTIINGQTPPAAAPTTGIRLVFVQNGRSASLGTVDANAQYTFNSVVAVPAWARPGQASVRAGESTASLTITAPGGSGPTDAGPTQLPKTGARTVLPSVLVAFGLLCWGVFLMRVGRRPGTLCRHRQ